MDSNCSALSRTRLLWGRILTPLDARRFIAGDTSTRNSAINDTWGPRMMAVLEKYTRKEYRDVVRSETLSILQYGAKERQ
jgi:hypothetical protein